jgi:hypothetical protein
MTVVIRRLATEATEVVGQQDCGGSSEKTGRR